MPRTLILVLSLLVCSSASAQTPQLVKDLHGGEGPGFAVVDSVGKLGNTAFFLAETPYEGRELWKTDGTAEGTMLVADFAPGTAGIGRYPLTANVFAGKLYFTTVDGEERSTLYATDGNSLQAVFTFQHRAVPRTVLNGYLYGIEIEVQFSGRLWRTNGTTVEFLELAALPGYQTLLEILVTAGNFLYFVANDTLWRSDGTSAGTTAVAPAAGGLPVAVGNRVVFTNGGDAYGTDGTPEGTVALHPYMFGVNVQGINTFGAHAYIAAQSLWVTDGTAEGTRQLSVNFSATAIGQVGSRVYAVGGGKLWYLDDPAGTLVEVRPMAAVDWPDFSSDWGAVALGNRLIFAGGESDRATQIWSTDGTAAGTIVVAEYSKWSAGIAEFRPIALGDRFVYPPRDGSQMFVSDGTPAGTRMLRATHMTGNSSNLLPWGAVRNRLLFSDFTSLHDLYATDGTFDGTVKLATLPAGASSHRGELWFNVDPAEGASELWRTDGTLNGTALFSTTLVAREPLVAGTLLGDGGEDVRLSDGTFSGTRPLETAVGKELPLTEWTHVATAHGIAYYVQTNPFRLWRVDGTAAGTRIIFQAAGGSTYANRSATVGNVVFFIAGSGMLIRTDGTEAGTALVHTFASIPDAMWSAGPRVFFRFNAAQELWTSDGTVTKLLRANWPAPAAMNNCAATVIPAGAGFGGFSFWLQTPDVVSSELWRSDGTTDGTIRLRAFRSRSSSFLGWLCEGLSLVSANGRLYFPGFDDDADGELWTSDGTAGGTRELFDLTDALGGSRPQSLTVAGTQLYFTAETPEIGRELYVLPNVNRLPLLAPLASRRVTPNTLVSFLLGGTDADGDSVTYSALSLPFGATLNGTTGAFAWTPSSAQTGSYTLTFVAADNAGGTATQSTTITVGTMAVFTDDPLLPGTRIKAVHFSELVIAINEYRAMASLAPIALSDFGAGAVIRATHLTTLRNGINQARAAMGLSAATFTGGTIVRAIHIQELRDLVR